MRHSYLVLAAFCMMILTAGAGRAESKGEQIFRQKCTMCHVVHGKGGTIGPELTRIGSAMQEKDMRAQLENPKRRNPSSSMPSFKSLPKAEMDALIGYLRTLK